MEVSGPAIHRPAHIDPRIRARRIAVRRGVGRRRLQRLVDVGLVAAVVAGFVVALQTPLLDVDEIAVRGNQRTPADAVVAASGIAAGDQLVALDLQAAGERVTALPWVQEARLHRGIDGEVVVDIIERVPVAVVGEGADALLVDAQGRALGPALGDPSQPTGLVAIDGVAEGLAPGEFLGEEAADALMVAASLREALAVGLRLAVVDGRLTGMVDPGISVAFGDASQLEAKVRSLRTVLDQVDLTCAASIDVRSPGSPVLTRDEACS
ncbi:MAG: FtsQ-type POTRA domain-containing protein [Acidimicrobiales bacterium]